MIKEPGMQGCNDHRAQLMSWLREALARESDYELQLRFHIELAEEPSYHARLSEHLTETCLHACELARRVEQLDPAGWGEMSARAARPAPTMIPPAAQRSADAEMRGGDGSTHRTSAQVELELRTVRVQLREQQVQVALYRTIETFAHTVGEQRTAALAASIGKAHARMEEYLSAELIRKARELARSSARVARAEAVRARDDHPFQEPALERTRRMRVLSPAVTAQLRSY